MHAYDRHRNIWRNRKIKGKNHRPLNSESNKKKTTNEKSSNNRPKNMLCIVARQNLRLDLFGYYSFAVYCACLYVAVVSIFFVLIPFSI